MAGQDGKGSGQPPSFRPGGGGQRPKPDDAIPVGQDTTALPAARPSRPAPPTSRPASQRPAAPSTGAGAGAGAAPRTVTSRPVSSRPSDAARSAGVRPGSRGGPGGPDTPADGVALPDGAARPSRPGVVRRRILLGVAIALVLLLAWPVGLVVWANGQVQHTDALSGAKGTAGTTYLLAGSDSRADGAVDDDGTKGSRTDTIMVLHVPRSGPTALISIPRDTYVKIPGHNPNKINAAFSYGGAPLLVATVEKLTGLTVDHYVEIGMGGIGTIVDAVGGVTLCLDRNVNDKKSKLKWKKGCHTVPGKTALAFARMRYSDPEGDIGRGKRQQQLISAVTKKIADPGIAVQPGKQVSLIKAGTGTLMTSEGMSIVDLGRLALAFKAANGDGGITGTPPISDVNYRPGGIGSAVRLDPDKAPQFFSDLAAGRLKPGKVGGMPG